MVKVIVGSNWGDEGKGKMTDFLTNTADIVVRFQGGNNAGHTIINNYGNFALHLLPSGVFYPQVTNVLGPGVALNILAFSKELDDFRKKTNIVPKIVISDRAQLLMPYHILLDEYEEERLKDQKFGSTKSGIAPFYSDKYAKTGIQIYEMFNKDNFIKKLSSTLEIKNIIIKNLYNKPIIRINDFIDDLFESFDKIKPFIDNTTYFLNKAIKEDKKILMEGQLGALRDPDHGIYPFSTSSSTLAGFSTVGAGIPANSIDDVIVVVKAYSSCVGEGPFVTEIIGINGDDLRNRGGSCGEYGAKTGRPRRVGWFDCIATKYGCILQGATKAALTLIDVLGYLENIKVCIGYELNGKILTKFPNTYDLYKVKPIYEELPGWKCDISNIKQYKDLPAQAINYIEFLETRIGIKFNYISNGPKRDDMILKNKLDIVKNKLIKLTNNII